MIMVPVVRNKNESTILLILRFCKKRKEMILFTVQTCEDYRKLLKQKSNPFINI
jgi:hypothetical protein